MPSTYLLFSRELAFTFLWTSINVPVDRCSKALRHRTNRIRIVLPPQLEISCPDALPPSFISSKAHSLTITMSRQTGSDQILLTQRLRLRPLSEDDAPVLYGVLSDPDVMKWTPSGPVQSVEEAREWIQTRALGRNTFHFVIEPLESNEYQNDCIGTIGCYGPPYVGYLIHPRKSHRPVVMAWLRLSL